MTAVEPPEGFHPCPALSASTPAPDATCQPFDPTDPADLELLCAHLLQRSGRAYRVPGPTEVPVDPNDPDTAWMSYPEDPAVRHHCRTTKAVVNVSFPTGESFRISGWVWEQGYPNGCRMLDRAGRFANCGPATLAWVLARFIDTELTGDRPATSHPCGG